mmetsp:Transcript_28143/g.70267  ORF Transcript_28143/g.70267 Transcript_28143/m.70267 type:complete len:354 (-) Transcript_28143:760-1821(-)
MDVEVESFGWVDGRQAVELADSYIQDSHNVQVLFLGNLHHVFVAVFGQRITELGVVQPHFGLVERPIEDVKVVLGIFVTPLDGSQVHDEAAKYVIQDIVLFGVVFGDVQAQEFVLSGGSQMESRVVEEDGQSARRHGRPQINHQHTGQLCAKQFPCGCRLIFALRVEETHEVSPTALVLDGEQADSQRAPVAGSHVNRYGADDIVQPRVLEHHLAHEAYVAPRDSHNEAVKGLEPQTTGGDGHEAGEYPTGDVFGLRLACAREQQRPCEASEAATQRTHGSVDSDDADEINILARDGGNRTGIEAKPSNQEHECPKEQRHCIWAGRDGVRLCRRLVVQGISRALAQRLEQPPL